MKAIILAGGFGTRLQPLTFIRPKHMLPIVDKPMIEHIVEYVAKHDFEEIILSIGNEKDFGIFKEYLSKKDFGTKISFISEPERLGGVGAIKYVFEKSGIKETFALIMGDNITNLDLKKMIEKHKEFGGLCTIGLVKTEEPWRFGIAELDGDQITNFVEKPEQGNEPSNLASTGIYIMEPKVIDFIKDGFFDSTGMLFPHLINEGQKIFGFKLSGYWIDVGNMNAYLEATRQILKQMGKKSEDFAVLGANVDIGDNVKIKDSIIMENTVIRNNAVIENAVVDRNVQIGHNVVIKNCIVGANSRISDNAKVFENVNINSEV